MKSISSGRTRRRHQKHKRTKKNTKKKYVKFPKRLKKQRKTLSEQSLKVANDYFICQQTEKKHIYLYQLIMKILLIAPYVYLKYDRPLENSNSSLTPSNRGDFIPSGACLYLAAILRSNNYEPTYLISIMRLQIDTKKNISIIVKKLLLII